MTDPRFFHRSGPFSLRDIAREIGAEPPAADAAERMIHDIAALEDAGPDDLSVFNDARYRPALADSRAGAIVTSHDLARHLADGARPGSCLLFCADPRLAYAQIGHLFYPAAALDPGAAAAARIHPSAAIGDGTQIDAGAIVGRGVVIGARCHVGGNVVLGDGVVLGDDCRIEANSSIGYALIGATSNGDLAPLGKEIAERRFDPLFGSV